MIWIKTTSFGGLDTVVLVCNELHQSENDLFNLCGLKPLGVKALLINVALHSKNKKRFKKQRPDSNFIPYVT